MTINYREEAGRLLILSSDQRIKIEELNTRINSLVVTLNEGIFERDTLRENLKQKEKELEELKNKYI